MVHTQILKEPFSKIYMGIESSYQNIQGDE